MRELYIGLMSGTSTDGIDAALVEFVGDNFQLLAFEYTAFSEATKKDIQDLSTPDSAIKLENYGSLDSKLGQLFAKACTSLLKNNNISGSKVTAIGNHGQTVYHAPQLTSAFSLQIGDPNIIAEETGITTIADFRRRDIAAGGQGAPLVPAFHQAAFSKTFNLSKQNICIVNIGGIANITYLSENNATGFDTGPGNTFMDYWTQKNLNTAYDKHGAWAKSGTSIQNLVSNLKQDAYFKIPSPKSTGKEYFSIDWLNNHLQKFSHCQAKDIQASLCQFTAETIAEAIYVQSTKTDHTLICGGGVHNKYLVELISKQLPHPVSSSAEFGINPDHVEAIAFAWLARQTIHNLSGNLIEVTGANRPVILGGIYPGKEGLKA